MAKHKIKSGSSSRKIQTREPYDIVLIVCEGSKTEIEYFNGLIKDLKLNTVNVKILDIKQTTPDSLCKKVKEFGSR